MRLRQLIFLCVMFATFPVHALTISLLQIPYHNPQQLEALIAQDDARFSWPQTQRVLERYLPSNIELVYLGEKGFFGNRHICEYNKTPPGCKTYMQNLADIMMYKKELGLHKMVIQTMDEIPYRDPQPLDDLLAMEDQALSDYLRANLESVRALLVQYIPETLIVDGPSEFGFLRAHCMYGTDLCDHYMRQLSELMHYKEGAAILINPFGR